MNIKGTVTLANGVEMPRLGLGVWQVEDGQEVVQYVKSALETGYIMIDTAAGYGNEAGVGQAIKEADVKREDIFVTTKVANSDQGYETTLEAFETSLNKLGLDYIDLYLIHWPVADSFNDTWKAMEELYESKKIRAIGVCNFHKHHFEKLMQTARIKPMVNQIELHPLLNQEPLRTYCAENNIVVEAYSPLGSGKILDNPVIKEIAEKYHKTVAQIILRWDMQIGVITIPKSVHSERIQQNAAIFDFELAEEDINKINALNKNERTGWNPERFDTV